MLIMITLSPYAKTVWKSLHGRQNDDTLPPRTKIEKLLTTLYGKEQYVVDYRVLQLYIQLGLQNQKKFTVYWNSNKRHGRSRILDFNTIIAEASDLYIPEGLLQTDE